MDTKFYPEFHARTLLNTRPQCYLKAAYFFFVKNTYSFTHRPSHDRTVDFSIKSLRRAHMEFVEYKFSSSFPCAYVANHLSTALLVRRLFVFIPTTSLCTCPPSHELCTLRLYGLSVFYSHCHSFHTRCKPRPATQDAPIYFPY